MSKEEFSSQIDQWIQIDNQLKHANECIKTLREKRAMVEKTLMHHESLLSSNIHGKIKLVNTRVPESLTFRYLERSLDELIKNKDQAKLILEHIKKNREIKIVPEIKRIS